MFLVLVHFQCITNQSHKSCFFVLFYLYLSRSLRSLVQRLPDELSFRHKTKKRNSFVPCWSTSRFGFHDVHAAEGALDRAKNIQRGDEEPAKGEGRRRKFVGRRAGRALHRLSLFYRSEESKRPGYCRRRGAYESLVFGDLNSYLLMGLGTI